MLSQIKLKKIGLLFLIMANISCESFEPKKINNLGFTLNSSLINALINPGDTNVILIEWDPLITSDFFSYQLERKIIKEIDWSLIASIADPYKTSFTDSIVDDDDLIYRLTIISSNGGNIKTLDTLEINPLTKFYVNSLGGSINSDFKDVQKAYDSPLIDDGDSIYVMDKQIKNIEWHFSGKSVLISGANTKLIGNNGFYPIVYIDTGIIERFVITEGYINNAQDGVGLKVAGDGIARQCIISNNQTQYGRATGLFMTEQASVYNCIILNNNRKSVVIEAAYGGSFYNNTIYDQEIEIYNVNDDLNFMNNIVFNGSLDFDTVEADSTGFDYNIIYETTGNFDDYIGVHTIIEDPFNFNDATIINYKNLMLPDTSPGLNTGNPSPDFNNTDGTRNTLGYEGGPYGWTIDLTN